MANIGKPLLLGGNQIEDDKRQPCIAVVEDQAAGIQVVVNGLGNAIGHRSGQARAQRRRNASCGRARLNLLFSHLSSPVYSNPHAAGI